MSNEYFTPTGYPATGAAGASASMRSELALISAGFDKMPVLTGNGGKIIAVNSAGTALSTSTTLSESAGTMTVAGNLSVTGNTTLGNASVDTLVVAPSSVTWSNNPTHSGAHTWSGNQTWNGTNVLSSGTANGVLYLNGSKVATSGSALTFDGTNLGVGGAPTTFGKLDVRNGVNYRVLVNGLAGYGNNAIAGINDAGSEIHLGLAGTPIAFYVQASEQMRLTSTGLGIGTSSPLVKFDVKGTTDTHVGITASGVDEAIILAYDDGGIRTPNLSYAAASHKFLIDTTERMRLDSSGNLGIGTTSPASKLDVNGTISAGGQPAVQSKAYGYSGTYYAVQIGAPGSNTTSVALAVDVSTVAGGGFQGQSQVVLPNNGALFVNAAGTDFIGAIRRDSSNRILIGPSTSGGLTLGDVIVDSSGNLGLGVTPSAWGTNFRALELQYTSGGSVVAGQYPVIAANTYNDNTNWIYKTTAAASYYSQVTGQHRWYTAPSGTAGNAISFTQAMTLDADGELGVGITSPTARLHAYSGTAMKQLTVDGIGAIKTGVNFANSGTTYGQIYFDNNAPYDMSVVQQYTTGSLIFGTNTTERMRIDSSGNVGIGRAPTSKLDILDNSTGDAVRITQTGGGNALVVEDSTSPDSTPFVVNQNGNVYVGNAGAENVQIGGSPVQPALQVVGNSDDKAGLGAFGSVGIPSLYLSKSSGSIAAPSDVAAGEVLGRVSFAGFAGSSSYIEAARISAATESLGFGYITGRLVFSTTAPGANVLTERMRIDSSGNVGIGRAPTSKLDILANSAGDALRITQTGTGNALVVEDETSPDASPFIIDGLGNVGINRTAPSALLDINGRVLVASATSIANDAYIRSAVGGAALAAFASNTNSTSDRTHWRLSVSDAEVGGIGTSGSGTSMSFLVGGTKRAEITSDGQLTLSASGALTLSKTAVTAPAASDGNVFSGTYTPTLTNVTNLDSSTAAQCQYMRVGNVVTVSGTFTADPTATGNTELGMSLPVSSALSANRQLGGTAQAAAYNNDNTASINADGTNYRAQIRWVTNRTTNTVYAFSFTYLVI